MRRQPVHDENQQRVQQFTPQIGQSHGIPQSLDHKLTPLSQYPSTAIL